MYNNVLSFYWSTVLPMDTNFHLHLESTALSIGADLMSSSEIPLYHALMHLVMK